jgi:hypothetical protein
MAATEVIHFPTALQYSRPQFPTSVNHIARFNICMRPRRCAWRCPAYYPSVAMSGLVQTSTELACPCVWR